MALLFFRGQFAGDLKGRIAGDAAETADPAARAIFWNEGEGGAVLERRDGRAQRAFFGLGGGRLPGLGGLPGLPGLPKKK